MTPQNNNNQIQQFPWFPETKPPLGGGALAGDWIGRGQQALGMVANALVYEVPPNSRVNSLPSPWSRALQFEQAVLNKDYPTRTELIEELFGCFAAVGLWQMFGHKLNAEEVNLHNFINIQDQAVGPFSRSLYSSLPLGDQALYQPPGGRNPWSTLYVLKVSGTTIGFTSPSTVLCPAVHLKAPIPGMKWTINGRFSDPTNFLSSEQRQALADWLSYLQQNLLQLADPSNQTIVAEVTQVLNGFIQNLTGGLIGNPVVLEHLVPELPHNPKAISMLARPAGGGVGSSSATIELGDRKRHPVQGTPKRPVIFLDPDMPGRLGVDANSIILWKAATLEAVACDKKRLLHRYGDEIEVITADDIFLPELFLLPGESALANSWLKRRLDGQPIVSGSPATPLLPLQGRMRELFSSRELEQNCSMQLVQDAGAYHIKVTINLPLVDSPNPYPVARLFPVKEQNLVDQDLPAIALWPHVSDDKWQTYYLFCEDSSMGLTVDGFSDYELQKLPEASEDIKFFRTKRFPDLIKLVERGQQRGLIAVDSPPKPTTNGAIWRVGIDFGTSFTNFLIDDGSGPSRKPLETRVIHLLESQKETRENLLYKYFIPEELLPKGENPPTSTALSVYGWAQDCDEVPEIYHQARIEWTSIRSLALRDASIRTGFKWESVQYQKPFLQELALLISCNAARAGATSVEWFVSYPSAFSRGQARRYRSLWNNLCIELPKLTGLSHSFVEDGGKDRLQSEAVAFASYFGNFLRKHLVHTACLDIGGGTTDISIWQRQSLLHQVSIPFAGRHLFSSILLEKPSFFRFLFSGDPSVLSQNASNRNCYIDNYLRYASAKLLSDKIPILRATERSKQLDEFISIVAVGFGGIYHYLGLVLKGLAKEEKLQRLSPVPLYLGGNGSRFLNWIDETCSFTPGCEVDKLFSSILLRSSGFSVASPETSTLSNAFKDEAACGLITQGVELQGDFDPRHEFMFAGENLIINGKLFSPLDRVCLPGEIDLIEQYEVGELTELRNYVRNYDQLLQNEPSSTLLPIKKLSLMNDEDLWNQVDIESQAICTNILNKSKKQIDNLELVPGFVIGLQALTKTLAQRWSIRE